jgi:hypothetical protein
MRGAVRPQYDLLRERAALAASFPAPIVIFVPVGERHPGFLPIGTFYGVLPLHMNSAINSRCCLLTLIASAACGLESPEGPIDVRETRLG